MAGGHFRDSFHGGGRFAVAVGVMLLTLMRPASAADRGLLVLFYDRPPLSYLDADNKPAGSIIDATARILSLAGLAYHFEIRPFSRAFHDVSEASGDVCSAGWYRTPDREDKVMFTAPLLHDVAPVGVVNDLSSARASDNAAATLSAMNSLLTMDGVSRGPYLDGLIAALPAERLIHRSANNVPNVLAMVAAHRADMTIISAAEADYYIKDWDSRLRIIHFSDVPDSGDRYIICSKHTAPAIIARLNEAIHELHR